MPDYQNRIPSVSFLLKQSRIKEQINNYGRELVVFSIRSVLEQLRTKVNSTTDRTDLPDLMDRIAVHLKSIAVNSLLPVVNATGIVLHTNLGRAPLGKFIQAELEPIISGYSNLEYDLQKGKRGQRNDHIRALLKYITGADDAVVVNNNAAAVMLVLKTFAFRKEVIISRGELIEIGGSFRIPEIMKASGAKMIEVGTTNRTRISDYEIAITPRTRVIFKAHKSNYFIGGFSEEASLEDLAGLAKKHDLLFIYDLGSGLLRKPAGLPLDKEPDVRTSLASGADIVTFSGDKLLGGPQAGIILGRKDLVRKVSNSPLMRVLRVGKLTIAALRGVIYSYLKDDDLVNNVPVFKYLNRTTEEKSALAKQLKIELQKTGFEAEILTTKAQVGGGSLPELELNSYAVFVKVKKPKAVFQQLLKLKHPVVGILREGKLMFDVQCLLKDEIDTIIRSLQSVVQ